MRKSKIIYLLVTGMVLFGLAGGAWANIIFTDPDNDVQRWQGNAISGSGALEDVIGLSSLFESSQAEVTTGKHIIFTTNWNPGKDTVINSNVLTAYLFIKQGANVYAIQLDTTSGHGNFFLNPTTVKTSQDIFGPLGSLGLQYGGRYNGEVPTSPYGTVPVLTTDTPTAGNTTGVTWSSFNSTATGNTVDVDLSSIGLNFGSPWFFVWATADCANDTIYGNVGVPEPGIMLLLGLGLVGLAGLRWKIKN
jgi:hypothetical protein